MSWRVLLDVLKTTFTEWQEDKASRLAAALAYYTVFSMAPLIIIVLGIVGFIFGQDMVSGHLLVQIRGLVGEDGAAVFQSIIENASQPSSSIVATLIGVGTLIFGATGLFAQLQDALNTVWGVAPKPGSSLKHMLETRFLSLTMVFGIGFLLLVSLILSAILSAMDNFILGWAPGSAFLAQGLNLTISFGIITLLFAMIYKVLPDVEIQWGDVWIGAAATSLLFSIGKFVLGFYLGNQSFGSTYGAAGSILIILLWVYYSAQILLFGAEFTQVYAKKFGSRLVPDEDAVALTPEMRARQGMPRSADLEAAAIVQERYKKLASLEDAPERGRVPGATPAEIDRGTVQLREDIKYRMEEGVQPQRDRFITLLCSLFLVGLVFRALFGSPPRHPADNRVS
jgi:membrane protein